MAKIRVLKEADVPGVVALFERVYPGQRWRSRAECERYFGEMLFANPWRELDLPSWVAEVGGRICGVYAVQPRRMRLNGRALRVAVGCQYMVDPEQRRSLIALELAKACISGPQDLTLADGANEASRRMWQTLGGAVPLLYGLHWTRPLRPARLLLSRLAQGAAARPLGALADALAARLRQNRFLREATDLVEEPLDAQTMLAHLPEALRGYALQPDHDAQSLAWLLEQAARKTSHGSLRARLVRDGARRPVGWYLHYLRKGATSEVLQIAGLNGSFGLVLKRLLADAWRHGALAVHGRLEPRFVRELSERHCWMRTDGTWTLAHSRHPEVMQAIHQGQAMLSRLEGEWWLRFIGESGGGKT